MTENVPSGVPYQELPEKKLAGEILTRVNQLLADAPRISREEFETDPTGNPADRTRSFRLADDREVQIDQFFWEDIPEDLPGMTFEPAADDMLAIIRVFESPDWKEKQVYNQYTILRDKSVEHVFHSEQAASSGQGDASTIERLAALVSSEKAQKEMGLDRVGFEELTILRDLMNSIQG